MNKPKEDSLKKRYFYKLFTNILSIPISLLSQSIIPRGLGPKYYGDYNFLLNFFTQVFGFFDMGTSICFYTKLSQRPKQTRLVPFYAYFVAIVGLTVTGLVVIAHTTKAYMKIWPGEKLFYIYLAIFLGLLTWLNQIMNQMVDAYGLTVSTEIRKIFQKLMGLGLIALLFFYHNINLLNFFLYNYILLLSLVLIFISVVRKNNYLAHYKWKLNAMEIKKYSIDFYKYSHPLFIYSIVGLVVGIFDRWLLQVFGGSIQQGFYGLSYQIAAMCFLFSSAMSPLIMREFSIAHNNKDIKLIGMIFRKHIPLLYSITAFFACFVAVNFSNITFLFGGERFKNAGPAVAIMALYPIHQTYGQLSGSLFYASDRIKLYRNIGILFMLIGLPVTYFLIAPKNLFGLNSGAKGLAIKTIVMQFLAVNVLLYFNAKFLGLSFLKYLSHQIYSLFCFIFIAFISAFVIYKIIGLSQAGILGFFLNVVLYGSIVYFFSLCSPVLFGLKKFDLNVLIAGFVKR